MTMYVFPEIDTSYWKLNDKDWVRELKDQWSQQIEPMFSWGVGKSKKGVTIIKQIFSHWKNARLQIFARLV